MRAAFVWNQKQLTVTVNPDVLPTELCHPLNWMQPCPYDGVTGGPPPRYGSLEVGYNLEIGGEAVGGGRVYSKLATGRFPNPARVGQMMIRSVQDDLWRAADFYAQEAEAARTSEAKEQREALTLSLALTLALALAPALTLALALALALTLALILSLTRSGGRLRRRRRSLRPMPRSRRDSYGRWSSWSRH